VHDLNGSIEWRLVGQLAAGSLPNTALALFALSRFGAHSGAVQLAVTSVLGGALAATAAVLVFRKRMLAFLGAVVGELEPWRTIVLTVLLGAVLHVLVSISSAGAGAFGVTASSCCIRGCRRRVSSAPTSRTPCRWRSSPASVTGRWVRSIDVYSAHCSLAHCPASFSAAICQCACRRRHCVLCSRRHCS
jgi:hypothetical protein